MKPGSILSAVMALAILAPIPAAAAGAAPPDQQRPALRAQALRQRVAGQKQRRAKLRKLSPEQRQQLRAEVKTLIGQSRATLRSGQHTRGQALKERMRLRLQIRKAVVKAIRGGGQ